MITNFYRRSINYLSDLAFNLLEERLKTDLYLEIDFFLFWQLLDIDRKECAYQLHLNWIRNAYDRDNKNQLTASNDRLYKAYPVTKCGNWQWALGQLNHWRK